MKAKALHIIQMDIPDYAKGNQELWTVKLVKEALIDAFRLLRHTAGRVGPGGVRAAWPEYFEPGDFPPEKTKTSPYQTRMTITRMEMVLFGWKSDDGRLNEAWLRGPLEGAPELKEQLEQWVFAELRGEATVSLCERRQWALATFKRHRDRAAGIIAHRLNMAGVEIW
jgi:hypothetical protein